MPSNRPAVATAKPHVPIPPGCRNHRGVLHLRRSPRTDEGASRPSTVPCRPVHAAHHPGRQQVEAWWLPRFQSKPAPGFAAGCPHPPTRISTVSKTSAGHPPLVEYQRPEHAWAGWRCLIWRDQPCCDQHLPRQPVGVHRIHQRFELGAYTEPPSLSRSGEQQGGRRLPQPR